MLQAAGQQGSSGSSTEPGPCREAKQGVVEWIPRGRAKDGMVSFCQDEEQLHVALQCSPQPRVPEEQSRQGDGLL